MTLTTTNMRVAHITDTFCTVGGDSDSPLQQGQTAHNTGLKGLMFTRVCPGNTRNRAMLAEIGRPILTGLLTGQQAAFFTIPTTIIITVKKITFLASRCNHEFVRRGLRTFRCEYRSRSCHPRLQTLGPVLPDRSQLQHAWTPLSQYLPLQRDRLL